ncbi:MAG: hypothetical protein HBSAPP01_12370 [Candidatus Brocadia sapporoensis]|nr:MAG: hypothetical protein HBSAPP01_12370 [Candidatus Brocadia sapporoensis]
MIKSFLGPNASSPPDNEAILSLNSDDKADAIGIIITKITALIITTDLAVPLKYHNNSPMPIGSESQAPRENVNRRERLPNTIDNKSIHFLITLVFNKIIEKITSITK